MTLLISVNCKSKINRFSHAIKIKRTFDDIILVSCYAISSTCKSEEK